MECEYGRTPISRDSLAHSSAVTEARHFSSVGVTTSVMIKFSITCRPALVLFCLCSLVPSALAQTPQWIWSGTNSSASPSVYFRKSFRTPPLLWNSRLTAAADDSAEVFLNGVSIARCNRPGDPVRAEVSVRLNQGENVIAVRALNRTGPAGLLVNLNLGGETNVCTDSSWLVSTNEEKGWSSLNFTAAHWRSATSLGAHGIAPWGNVLAHGAATQAEALTAPHGFKVELLRSARADEGSWICMAFDERGRLLISPQGDERPLLRFV